MKKRSGTKKASVLRCRTFSEPVRAVVLKLLPFLPAAKEREAHFVRLYGIWDGWVKEMQARGPPAETDDSMWACITRVRDPSTGGCTSLFCKQNNVSRTCASAEDEGVKIPRLTKWTYRRPCLLETIEAEVC